MYVALLFCKPRHANRPGVSEMGTNTGPTGAPAGHVVTDMELNPLKGRSRDQLKQ